MSKRSRFGLLIGALFLLPLVAGAEVGKSKFSFLDGLEKYPEVWTRESTESDFESSPALDIDMRDYYREFTADRRVSIYVGYGYEAYFPDRPAILYKMLWQIGSQMGLSLDSWLLTSDYRRISFRDWSRGIVYQITIGNERDEYIDAFSKYEIVMYTGHSRYGRGPTFGNFSNYFRIGKSFDTVEVDARNPYFLDEPLKLTDQFPQKNVWIGNWQLPYQYRGARIASSYLPDESYTKNIPGYDADLRRTRFLPGRQIFYFNSCKNRQYWRETFRSIHPDSSRKIIFGTREDSPGGNRPDAVMIMSVVRGISKSAQIVDDLNAVRDCAECYTSY